MAEITRSSKPKTQREAVIYHLKYIGTLTAGEGMMQYGIFRLAVIIDRLRDEVQGSTWSIETIEEQGTNRFGRNFTYARYKLHQ